ncbi:MAG: N-acetylmuramoyl-L-alanine amidase [Microcoleaceae cyanobacterium]
MGRIFLSAGQEGIGSNLQPSGISIGGTTAIQEMIGLRDFVAAELRSRGLSVYIVGDDFNPVDRINWINHHCHTTDVAIELQTAISANSAHRGISIFHIADNAERKRDAQTILTALLRRVPSFPNRGIVSDSQTPLGSIGFCRWLSIPSLYIEMGYFTNAQDRILIQMQRRAIARGLAEGIATWSYQDHFNSDLAFSTSTPVYATIGINLNGYTYPEQGILIQGNAYLPIDLIDHLGINFSQTERIRRVKHRQIVYIKAIDLKDFGISIHWDDRQPIIIINSKYRADFQLIKLIMGRGKTNKNNLSIFLKSHHSTYMYRFPEIIKLYFEEAEIEGVNHDIAFCQMCLETDFLRFGGIGRATDHNFAGLATVGGMADIATFSSPRMGVRAHIQHLKAYASREPLVQVKVDPRFDLITRGIAPSLDQLSGRWSEDLNYGTRIYTLMQQLYQTAGLL